MICIPLRSRAKTIRFVVRLLEIERIEALDSVTIVLNIVNVSESKKDISPLPASASISPLGLHAIS
jgi:hypothetical protein